MAAWSCERSSAVCLQFRSFVIELKNKDDHFHSHVIKVCNYESRLQNFWLFKPCSAKWKLLCIFRKAAYVCFPVRPSDVRLLLSIKHQNVIFFHNIPIVRQESICVSTKFIIKNVKMLSREQQQWMLAAISPKSPVLCTKTTLFQRRAAISGVESGLFFILVFSKNYNKISIFLVSKWISSGTP